MNKMYVFYSDPGHAWIAVKIKELFELNIVDKISRYSYVKGSTAYLEEDCDYHAFDKAYKEKYGFPPNYKVRSTEKRHPIRSYEKFVKAEVIEKNKKA
jgi:hypothetical protein